MNSTEYRRQLELLLPTGQALVPEEDTVLHDFLQGIAVELARIDSRGVDVLNEADPRTTQELFNEWLSQFGIPDDCSVYAETPEDERTQLLQKLTKQSGQTPQFYIELAEALGYDSRIQEFREFLVDVNSCEDPLHDAQWVYAFSLVISEPPVVARAGVARAGDRLGSFEAPFLYCLLQKARPGHAVGFLGFE